VISIPDPELESEEEITTEGTYAILERARYDETMPPPDNPPVAHLGGTGVLWKGNVHTLVAASKVGKSRFLAALIRSLVKGERALGWSENEGGHKVIYLDFEQDHEDFFDAMHNQAGVTKEDVYAYNLAGVSAAQAIKCVEVVLEIHPDTSVLLADGVADLSNNVNDPEESNRLIAHLMDLSVKRDVATLGVLHLNPGSEVKSRGHLGSQLERKSKVILQIDEEEGVRNVYTRFSRKKPIQKKDGIRFQWCDDEKNFVEVTETKEEEKRRLEEGDYREMMDKITMFSSTEKFTYKEIVNAVMGHRISKKTKKNIGETTAKKIVKSMVDYEILSHDEELYIYQKEGQFPL
jgi:hypothetical protein